MKKNISILFLLIFISNFANAAERIYTEKEMAEVIFENDLVYTKDKELITGKAVFERENGRIDINFFEDGVLTGQKSYFKSQLIGESTLGKGLKPKEQKHYYLDGTILTHYELTDKIDISGNPIMEGDTYYQNGNIASKNTTHQNEQGEYSLIEVFNKQGRKLMEIIVGASPSGYCYLPDGKKREATSSEIDAFNKETLKIQFQFMDTKFEEPDFSSVCKE